MSALRTAAKRALWHSGFYSLAARRSPWNGVAVLAYHGLRNAAQTTPCTSEELHVRVSVFESQLRALREVAAPISLADWRTARRTGRSLPRCATLLTFDDGYRSVLRHAVPLLEKYDVPAVLFVCTGPSGTGTLLWYDALERQGRSAEIERAKELPYDEWRALTAGCPALADANDERAVLTPDEIARLARHPLIEIGAHTVDHPVLARASVAVQRQQIEGSVTTLEQWTGKRPRAFAYPNGRPICDFTAATAAIVRDVGLDCAFSTEPRLMAVDEPMDAVPRFTMLDAISDAQLAQNLTLSWPRRHLANATPW